MNTSPLYHPERHANVCLLLEGTYPYIRGGVSSWVKQLIEGMPELTFSIVFLGGKADDYDEPAYDIPANVVHMETHFLLAENDSTPEKPKFWKRKADKSALFERSHQLHDALLQTDTPPGAEVVRDFTTLLSGSPALGSSDLYHGEEAWETIRSKYIDAPEGLDFNHYFWTVRTMHGPLFTLAEIVKSAPSADLYHSVSTGYAGYLGAMLSSKTAKPFYVTEHGIYTKEREIDLAHVDWIPDDLDPYRVGLDDSMSFLRQTWVRFFRSLGRMTYSTADHVYTLFEGNRLRQIEDGADETRLTIIPNGVNVQQLSTIRRSTDADIPPVLALIGRIVPIKDVKTFIRGMRIICATVPDAQGWLVGPEDEDPNYVAECRAMVESFGLTDSVKFLGFQNIQEIMPKIGLTVLTSISEGQPLTTLEGFAAGIPAVTTDVGSCAELIHGGSDEDKKLGAAGAVVPIANPASFAEAAIALLTDAHAWRQASTAACTRAETYYDAQDMIQRYREIYTDGVATGSRLAPVKHAEGF
jgi:glycosyltransferase involved in cell wall biosynthesis